MSCGTEFVYLAKIHWKGDQGNWKSIWHYVYALDDQESCFPESNVRCKFCKKLRSRGHTRRMALDWILSRIHREDLGSPPHIRALLRGRTELGLINC